MRDSVSRIVVKDESAQADFALCCGDFNRQSEWQRLLSVISDVFEKQSHSVTEIAFRSAKMRSQ